MQNRIHPYYNNKAIIHTNGSTYLSGFPMINFEHLKKNEFQIEQISFLLSSFLGIRQENDKNGPPITGSHERTTMDCVVVEIAPRFVLMVLQGLGSRLRSMCSTIRMCLIPRDTAVASSEGVVTLTGTDWSGSEGCWLRTATSWKPCTTF